MDFKGIVDDNFRGCVKVRCGDKTIFEHSSGYANLSEKLPNTPSTKFACASGSKAFVAAGILRLIEEGAFSFNDTLEKLVPIDWKGIDSGITVFQLLSHTSGIPDYFDEEEMDDYEALWADYPNYKIRSNSDLLPLFIHKPMMFPKGTKCSYNNTGYVVLAMIIEEWAKMPFDEYLKEKVFKPCGMDDTGYYELDMLPEGCAMNYIFDERRSGWRTNIFSVDAKGTGAGGAFTTTGDVIRFWQGILDNKLFSAKMASEMLGGKAALGDGGFFGYGVKLKKLNEDTIYPFFQGQDPGVCFVSSYLESKNAIICVISNYGDDVWAVNRRLLELFCRSSG